VVYKGYVISNIMDAAKIDFDLQNGKVLTKLQINCPYLLQFSIRERTSLMEHSMEYWPAIGRFNLVQAGN